MDENERKNHAVYVGTIRRGSVQQIPARCRACRCISVGSAGKQGDRNGILSDRLDPDHLLLFQDVFQKCVKALCRESGVPGKDI